MKLEFSERSQISRPTPRFPQTSSCFSGLWRVLIIQRCLRPWRLAPNKRLMDSEAGQHQELMSNDPLPTENKSDASAATSSEAQKLAQDAWQPTKLLDACVGAETDKATKMQVVEIIHFHRLAVKEFKDSPDRKRLAGQTALRKIRQLLPHRSPEKLQRLLNATVEQLTASGSLK